MVSVRQKLTEPELIVAFIIGAGLTLLVLGFGLAAIQTGTPNLDVSRLNLIMVIGGLLFMFGTIAWLVIVRPWKNFDDWSTPLYTGHDDHGAHDSAHGGADDLTHIDGITDKISAVLHSVGITTYAELASHQPAEIERIVADAGLRASGKGAAWVAQAKAAASTSQSSSAAPAGH